MKNPSFVYAKAFRGYRALAARGNAEAMLNLGLMYENGQGVPRNLAEAARWYEKSGALGHVMALVRSGAMQANGKGVTKDMVGAYARFALARDLGHPGASDLLDKIKARLDKGQIESALALAKDMKARIG